MNSHILRWCYGSVFFKSLQCNRMNYVQNWVLIARSDVNKFFSPFGHAMTRRPWHWMSAQCYDLASMLTGSRSLSEATAFMNLLTKPFDLCISCTVHRFKNTTLAEWTVSCSAVFSVRVFPDRVALVRFSHTTTNWGVLTSFSRSVCADTAFTWLDRLLFEISCVTQGNVLIGRYSHR